jgi:hypothetical protein
VSSDGESGEGLKKVLPCAIRLIEAPLNLKGLFYGGWMEWFYRPIHFTIPSTRFSMNLV